MAQSTTIMAFRKRLAFRGYTNISIKKIKGYEALQKPDTYKITATEPLGKTTVTTEYSTEKMPHSFR